MKKKIMIAALSVFFLFQLSAVRSYDDSHLEAAEDGLGNEEVSRVLELFGGFKMGLTDVEELGLAKTIVERSAAYDIDPMLICALIKTESTFKSRARSHKGAIGMMQILPSTGREVARDLNMDWNGKETLYDPSENVRLGIHYFSGLLDMFEEEVLAIAAYNNGPYGIKKRLRRARVNGHGNLKSAYADRVLNSYAVYRDNDLDR